MNRIAIVSLAYALVWGVQSTPYSGTLYYFLLACTSFALVLICSKSNDETLIVYGVLNVLCILLYICAIFPTNKWVFGVLYYPSINYSIIVSCFELFIISSGFANAVRVFYNRFINANCINLRNSKGNFEARV